MYIFIDESGIHKNIDHSAIVFVYLKTLEITEIEDKIIALESKLKINYFHWADFGSRQGLQIRKKFIEGISELEFTFKVVILKNPIHFPSVFRASLIKMLIETQIDKLVIDGKQFRRNEKNIKSFLRSQGISVKKLKTCNDISSPGLRLADALAGLIRSYHDSPNSLTEELYNLVEHKKTTLAGGQDIR